MTTERIKNIQTLIDHLGREEEMITSTLTDLNELPIDLVRIVRNYRQEHTNCVNDLVSFIESHGLADEITLPKSLRITYTKKV